jgi:flagellar hook-associated protein 2
MTISSPGIGSGLDVNSIVTQLMALERQPITLLDTKEASAQAKLSAYGTLKGALSSFQSAVAALSTSANFAAVKATTADTTVVSAAAQASAVAGNYAIDVSQLAQAQKLVSAGQASSSAAIGTGTLTFDFGTIAGGSLDSETGQYTGAAFTSNGSGSKTITIDAAHASLEGIRDAINGASVGVTATLINDGSGTPYRLALSVADTGVDNSLKIGVSGDAALASLLAQDPAGTQSLTQTVAAKNAEFTVDGLAITKATNSVTDVIQGVSLNLLKESATSITVARDSSSATTSINAFVKAYNDLNTTLSSLSKYDATNNQASILTGDSAVRSVQTQVRGIFNSALTTAGGGLTTLSDVGISFKTDGTLQLDSAKLGKVIADPTKDVSTLFAAVGKSTDSLVAFAASTDNTHAGSYALNITQLASQGKAVGSSAAGLTITTDANDALDFTIDGVAVSVTLDAGTYTPASLASALQSRLNGATALSDAGVTVSVTQNSGVLTVASDRYGSASKVAVTGGNGSVGLFGTATSTDGLNIAGTIGGQSASGNGQTLTASGGNAAGLAVTVVGGATGDRGVVNFANGFAYQLDKLVAKLLDTNGVVDSRVDGLNASIKDIDKRREALELRMTQIEARYRAQFTALDTAIASMNKTSEFLTQQLANLPSTSTTTN